MPTTNDKVTVHYTGKLLDGTVFDSSVQRGSPATFGVTQVIAGWVEALQLMHEGDKWILFIPEEIGYGDRGNGPQIPPYSTLVFELELIKVN
jgi:FKBP-type peptidyl-prolyl cis-trans isomerase FklB